MEGEIKRRDFRIDILRTIGTLLVILAHISTLNSTIKSIRSFDVILLVFISGISYSYSNKSTQRFSEYFISRIKRLCVPAWITVVVVLFLSFILCIVDSRPYIYDVRTIIGSFLFTDDIYGSIGNVWIVRIYLIVALLAPSLTRIDNRIKSNHIVISVSYASFIISEVIFLLFYGKNSICDYILDNLVICSLVYGAVYLLAFRVSKRKDTSVKYLVLTFLMFLCTQIMLLFLGKEWSPNAYKFPPRIPYVFYGLMCSIALWVLVSRIDWCIFENTIWYKTVVWLSKRSFQLYLIHTVVVRVISWGYYQIGHWLIIQNAFLCYMLVIMISVVLLLVYDQIISCSRERKRWRH